MPPTQIVSSAHLSSDHAVLPHLCVSPISTVDTWSRACLPSPPMPVQLPAGMCAHTHSQSRDCLWSPFVTEQLPDTRFAHAQAPATQQLRHSYGCPARAKGCHLDWAAHRQRHPSMHSSHWLGRTPPAEGALGSPPHHHCLLSGCLVWPAAVCCR